MCPEPPEKNQDYRQEARNIRATAREMQAAEARTQLLLIASLYDKLADLLNNFAPSLQAKLADNSRNLDPTEGTDAV
jgi:hypothetical protein